MEKRGDDRTDSTPMIRAILIGSAIILTPVVLFVAFITFLLHPGEDKCEQRQAFAESLSPDGAWIARFYDNVCSSGGLAPTFLEDTVEIARPNEKHTLPTVGVVFAMEAPRNGEAKPMALRWVEPRRLEITIPNDAWAGKQEMTFADVSISYRYVPDDPVERACLKQWRSLPTDEMVRRSSSPTENIRAFLAKCHANGGPR